MPDGVAHEVRIGLRCCSAQLMIEVRDMQLPLVGGRERMQGVEQAQRIGSARHADNDQRAAWKQIVAGDKAVKVRQEIHAELDYNDKQQGLQDVYAVACHIRER